MKHPSDSRVLIAQLEAALREPSPDSWDPDLDVVVRELGERGAAEAIPLMVQLCDQTDALTLIHDACAQALCRMGAAGVEPLLEAYSRATDIDTRVTLECALAELGARDPRILSILFSVLDRDLDFGAGHLAMYGDPAALPSLEQALEEFEVVTAGDDAYTNHAVVELVAAIEGLGGVVSKEARAKLAEAQRILRRASARGPAAGVDHAPATREPKTGRNDACWCGSGKKFKRCHLREGGEG